MLSLLLATAIGQLSEAQIAGIVPAVIRTDVPHWPASTSPSANVQDLHREYNNIFRHGNRNAASHLWASFLLERSSQMTWERLEYMFTGFCAVSGSPVRPGDYQRYVLQLPSVTGGELRGFMYYCCWPCVCDTNDWIRVDTLTITASDGIPQKRHVAVIGNPCLRPEALHEPFHDPFGRGQSTLAREAPEVRCGPDGTLLGATMSDHGYVVIQLFPLVGGDGTPLALPGSVPTTAVALALPENETPTPGRIRRDERSGLNYQDEGEFAPMCKQREENGFNSGMGEIFRRVAQITKIPIAGTAPALEAPSATDKAEECANSSECATTEEVGQGKKEDVKWSPTPRDAAVADGGDVSL